MMRKDFCALILSHGRPDSVKTLHALRYHGYTGDVCILVDSEDNTKKRYKERYGDLVYIFDKDKYDYTVDRGDNRLDRKGVIWARNASFSIAKRLGYRYFVQLDDDYSGFKVRAKTATMCRNLDNIFEAFVDFVSIPMVKTVAMSQGGDHIGGFDGRVRMKRKAMNSFFCDVEKPFRFVGRINEDTNTYVDDGRRGGLWLTLSNVQLDQEITQSQDGGMTGLYLDYGTYTKSFYSVMYAPSCVAIKEMGVNYKRLHHTVNWDAATPRILHEKWRR